MRFVNVVFQHSYHRLVVFALHVQLVLATSCQQRWTSVKSAQPEQVLSLEACVSNAKKAISPRVVASASLAHLDMSQTLAKPLALNVLKAHSPRMVILVIHVSLEQSQQTLVPKSAFRVQPVQHQTQCAQLVSNAQQDSPVFVVVLAQNACLDQQHDQVDSVNLVQLAMVTPSLFWVNVLLVHLANPLSLAEHVSVAKSGSIPIQVDHVACVRTATPTRNLVNCANLAQQDNLHSRALLALIARLEPSPLKEAIVQTAQQVLPVTKAQLVALHVLLDNFPFVVANARIAVLRDKHSQPHSSNVSHAHKTHTPPVEQSHVLAVLSVSTHQKPRSHVSQINTWELLFKLMFRSAKLPKIPMLLSCVH